MNTSQINGALLGNGTPDHRSFLTLLTAAAATTTAAIIAYLTLTGDLLARALSSVVMSGKVYVGGVSTATATSVAELSVWTPSNLNGDTVGTATSVITLTPERPLAGATSALATFSMALSNKVAVTLTTTARATSNLYLISAGKPAPTERTIWLAPQNRTMMVF